MSQRVINLTDFGAAEKMELIETSIPDPSPDQIIVKNKAIGLNYLDTYFRSGLYPWPNENAIKIPGSEGVGNVYSVGSNVNDFKEGNDNLVIFDTITGFEKARVVTDSKTANGMFLSTGWDSDIYYCSISSIARLYCTN